MSCSLGYLRLNSPLPEWHKRAKRDTMAKKSIGANASDIEKQAAEIAKFLRESEGLVKHISYAQFKLVQSSQR